MTRFNEAMVPEVVQPFWGAMQRGEFITDAAEVVGTYRQKGRRWLRDAGGVRPRRGRNVKGRCLSFAEREQIAGRLRVEFPDRPEMWVSTETIYQSLYVQARGALRRELAACLRTGRAMRRPSRSAGQRKNRIPDMINIS